MDVANDATEPGGGIADADGSGVRQRLRKIVGVAPAQVGDLIARRHASFALNDSSTKDEPKSWTRGSQVVESNEMLQFHQQPGLFKHFPDRRFLRALARLDRAAWKPPSPATVVFADEQNAILAVNENNRGCKRWRCRFRHEAEPTRRRAT